MGCAWRGRELAVLADALTSEHVTADRDREQVSAHVGRGVNPAVEGGDRADRKHDDWIFAYVANHRAVLAGSGETVTGCAVGSAVS